jgi:hypothetical protein
MRIARTALAVGLLLAVWPAAAQEEVEADHAALAHRFVKIRSGSLHPQELFVGTANALGWLNYSGRLARVVFPGEAAKKLHCTAPGGFRLADGRLESREIGANQFASLCQLEPGRYEYEVELRSGAGQTGGRVPVVRRGTIVVR